MMVHAFLNYAVYFNFWSATQIYEYLRDRVTLTIFRCGVCLLLADGEWSIPLILPLVVIHCNRIFLFSKCVSM